MTALEYIKKRVKKPYQGVASVIAHIDEKEWWHVHLDEELPTENRLTVRINGLQLLG